MGTVAEDRFPYADSMRERLRFLLRYALRAPSTHNTQPWIFKLSDDYLEVFADSARALHALDPNGREWTMSVGAAIDHLRLAMVCHLLEPTIEVLPDPARPHLVARVSCLSETVPTSDDLAAFGQTFRRATFRGEFEGKEVTDGLKASLARQVDDTTAGIVFVQENEMRDRLSQMVQSGCEDRLAEEDCLKEAVEWVRMATRATDGIPVSALGMGAIGTATAPLLKAGHRFQPTSGYREARQVTEAPALAIVCTRGDDPRDWVYAGMALSRLALAASAYGVRCSYYLQPIQDEDFRLELTESTKALGFPQIVVRLGYAPEGDTTPRRSLDDVLVERVTRRFSKNGEQTP